MTPTVGWTPADYYRASRQARRAFERTSQQLQMDGVLDQVDAGTDGTVGVHLIERAPVTPSSGGALHPTATEVGAQHSPVRRARLQSGD